MKTILAAIGIAAALASPAAAAKDYRGNIQWAAGCRAVMGMSHIQANPPIRTKAQKEAYQAGFKFCRAQPRRQSLGTTISCSTLNLSVGPMTTCSVN